jgi:glutamate synthase (NADPH/NADH)
LPSLIHSTLLLPNRGELHYRSTTPEAGALPMEEHLDTPTIIASLQSAARNRSRADFAAFSRAHDEQVAKTTLRGLLDFVEGVAPPIALDTVQPASEIVRRFRSGAMSYGSIRCECMLVFGRIY